MTEDSNPESEVESDDKKSFAEERNVKRAGKDPWKDTKNLLQERSSGREGNKRKLSDENLSEGKNEKKKFDIFSGFYCRQRDK